MDYKKNGWASFTNAALNEKASIIFQRLKAEKPKYGMLMVHIFMGIFGRNILK